MVLNKYQKKPIAIVKCQYIKKRIPSRVELALSWRKLSLAFTNYELKTGATTAAVNAINPKSNKKDLQTSGGGSHLKHAFSC